MTTATARNRFAAVLLLAPLAAAVFAMKPAHAQVYVQWPAPAVVVQSQPMAAPPAQVVVQDRYEYRHGGWDRRGPEISDVTPYDGSRVVERGHRRTEISARIGDNRSGIDYSSIRLRIDGRDVTHRARIDGNDVRYREDLHPGRHVAELAVRDRAGNWSRRAWSFDVIEHGHRYGYYDGGNRW
jgi:hypothetical protein